MTKSELKSTEYRARARDEAAAAEACLLERKREQHVLAAERWTQLAEDEERRASKAAAVAAVAGQA